MTRQIVFYIICLLVTVRCQNRKDFIHEYMKNYSDISGKKLIVHEKLKNFIEIKILSDLNTNYKMICTGYSDCSPCIMYLKDCEKFLNRNNKLLSQLTVIFILSGEESDYFAYQLKKNDFSFPIFHDTNSSFISINGLENYDKSVFLVNKCNEVILVGSPFNNKVLEKYYRKIILKK